jgi:hypothetical protein
MVTSKYCSREDICKPIIVDSGSFNWTKSRDFSFTLGGFSWINFGVLLVVVARFIFQHCS